MQSAWLYVRSEPHLFTVGFYDPRGKWHPDSDHESRDEAAARVHYLNGGVERATAPKLCAKHSAIADRQAQCTCPVSRFEQEYQVPAEPPRRLGDVGHAEAAHFEARS